MLKHESVQKELQFTERKLKLVKGQQQRQRKEQKRLLQRPGKGQILKQERMKHVRELLLQGQKLKCGLEQNKSIPLSVVIDTFISKD